MEAPTAQPSRIAIIGAGLGGLSAAVALRRQGHHVTVYERRDFSGEVGAALGITPNASRFLREWSVDVQAAKPVTFKKFIVRSWSTGEIENISAWEDYKSRFGIDYYCFHRIDLHQQLLKSALEELGDGPPCKLKVNHKAIGIDYTAGLIRFENGEVVMADLIVAADGIRSLSRGFIGVEPNFKPSTSCCYRFIIRADKLRDLGLDGFTDGQALEYWGGVGIYKVVLTPCSAGEVIACYCFYPAAHNDLREAGWSLSATPQELVEAFPEVDPRMKTVMLSADDIKMWRLYVHPEYPWWVRGKVCLLGDAAHPMMPDQAQGSCMAIEDAGALGLIFHKNFLSTYTVEEGLELYEKLRKPRASRIQEASYRAREDVSERIGFSGKNGRPGKLTMEEVCGYKMEAHLKELVEGQIMGRAR